MTYKSNEIRADGGDTPGAGERSLQAKIAAHVRWSKEADRAAATAPARAAAIARFEREVDPDGVLSPQERALRAEAARRAHLLKMALRSAQVRRKRKAATKGSGEAA